jgi:phosphatidylserine/phosphatidylglycerophosphate/cardiolipin synthase-like enzyme
LKFLGSADVMGEEPKYYGSWKGRVIEAIVRNGLMDWNGLLEFTELSPKSLNKAIAELHQNGILTKEKDGKYKVIYEVYKEYKAFFNSQDTSAEEKIVDVTARTIKGIDKIISATISSVKEKDIKSWINDWKKVNNLAFSVDSNHFYLKGGDLEIIIKGLIQRAKEEILVVNPFINQCNLSNAIGEAGKKGVKTTIITRPIGSRDMRREEIQDCHDELMQSNVVLKYNNSVHAKLVIVDREVAVISSMNFIPTSSGGSSWEAGVVSIDEAVVKSVVESIMNIRLK